MTNGLWRRARTPKVCLWGLGAQPTQHGSLREASQTPRCSGTLMSASSICCPPGTRKGEESEKEWAPVEKISE